MNNIVRLSAVVGVALAALAGGCADTGAVDADEHDGEVEQDPGSIEQGSEELISSVSCKERTDTAYTSGSPSKIQVITIGGKPTSKATGHAFLKMQKAAHEAGVYLAINSGFRTMSEQQYFYNCYKTGSCNNGNLAAKPGYSNHQSGIALDLTTSSWLANNASKYGFIRTVPSEAWHYEYSGADPGGPCSGGRSTETNVDDAPAAPSSSPSAGSPSSSAGVGKACASHGQCNPGNDGSGLICVSSKCVAGCVSNAQCPGSTSCQAGQCR
jgi:hypothetical protein